MKIAYILFIFTLSLIITSCTSDSENLQTVNNINNPEEMSLLIEEGINSGYHYEMSRDGSLIAIYDGDDLIIKSLSSGKTIKRMDIHSHNFEFAPAADYFYVAKQGVIHIWDVKNNWQHSSFNVPDRYISHISVSPTGQKILIRVSGKGPTHLIYSHKGKELSHTRLQYKKKELIDPKFIDENNLISVVDYDRKLIRVKIRGNRYSTHVIYDGTPRVRRRPLKEIKGISQNRKFFATGYDNPDENSHIKGQTTKINIRRIKDGKVVRSFIVNKNYNEKNPVYKSIQINHNGHQLALKVNDIPIIYTNKTAQKFPKQTYGYVEFIRGKSLALIIPSSHSAAPSLLYDGNNKKVVSEFYPGLQRIYRLTFNNQVKDLLLDGSRINLATGAYIPSQHKSRLTFVNSIGESFSVTQNGEIYKLNKTSWNKVYDFKEHKKYKKLGKEFFDSLDFYYVQSQDQKTLAIVSSIGDMYFVDLDKMLIKDGMSRFQSPYQFTSLVNLKKLNGDLGSYIFDQNGKFTEFRNFAKLDELYKQKKKYFDEHFDALNDGLTSAPIAITISNNGQYFAIAESMQCDSPEDAIRVFDTKKNKVLFTLDLKEFETDANSGSLLDFLEFTPDGKYLVVASEGDILYKKSGNKLVGTVIKIWRVSDQKVVKVSNNETGFHIQGISISKDSRQLLAWDEFGSYIIFDMETKKRIKKGKINRSGRIVVVKATNKGFFMGADSGAFYNINTKARFEGFFNDAITDIIDVEDHIAISSKDGTVKLFDANNMDYLYSVVSLAKDNYLIANNKSYYIASPEAGMYVNFKQNNKLYSFEDYDLTRNRPDLVLKTMGFTKPEVIHFYETLYNRRKQIFNGHDSAIEAVDQNPQRPEITLNTLVPFVIKADKLDLNLTYKDYGTSIASLHARVNGVPVFGKSGVKFKNKSSYKNKISVPLVFGRNKVDLFVTDTQGVRSKVTTTYTNNTKRMKTNLYVVSIGVSDYADNRLDLNYAAKDAQDIARSLMKRFTRKKISKAYKLVITDKNASKASIISKTRSFLSKAKFNDIVVVFFAGHGFSDAGQYYFAGNDININNVRDSGVSFDKLDGLLSNISANRKIVLFDTCFSGQEDLYDSASKPLLSRHVRSRNISITRGLKHKNRSPIQQKLIERLAFNNFSQGSGALVLSSSGQQEFSYEDETYKNGIFTYSLLKALDDRQSDLDKDGALSIRELESYIAQNVIALTAGQQQPNIRNENINMNFELFSQ